MTGRIDVHTARHKTYPICDSPLSWSARRNFAPSQKPRRHNRSYVWRETLSGKICVTAQKLSGIVWTCLKSTVFRKVTLLLTSLLVLERSCKQFGSECESKSTVVRAITLLLTADRWPLTAILVLERSWAQSCSECDCKSTVVRAVTLLLTADRHSYSRTFVATILKWMWF